MSTTCAIRRNVDLGDSSVYECDVCPASDHLGAGDLALATRCPAGTKRAIAWLFLERSITPPDHRHQRQSPQNYVCRVRKQTGYTFYDEVDRAVARVSLQWTWGWGGVVRHRCRAPMVVAGAPILHERWHAATGDSDASGRLLVQQPAD